MLTTGVQTHSPLWRTTRPRGDGFAVLRLFAAFLVFHSHFYALRGDVEPSLPWTYGASYGGQGVLIFFAISGSLVGRSALQRSAADFLVSRLLRIEPALVACTLLLMVIGAAVTTVPLSSYFTHPDTINFLNTALIWITTCRDTLPGLFAGRPFPDLDGSLWTLRYEVLCYGFLAAASLMGPHVVRWGAVLALIGLPVDAFFPPSRAVSIGLMSNYVEYILFEFSAVFAVGVLTCWMNRQSLGRSVLATTLLLVLCWNSDPLRFIAWHFFLAFAAVYVGRYTRLDRFLPGGADISYGFYIYAWPMTQLAEAWFKHIKYGGPLSYVVALFMTIFLATASWFLIERPALALKPRIARWLDARLPVIPLEA